MTMIPRSITLQRARVVKDNLMFETPGGLMRALRDGCFFLAIPLNLDVSPGIKLCREFYQPTLFSDTTACSYRGFREREEDGIYFDREHFQTEHILLDRLSRTKYFPSDLITMCDEMSYLSLIILRCVLTELNVAESLWSRITGGTIDGQGTHWFAASHYRSEREQLGCAPHKDTGFVTILYIEQPGLEAWMKGTWVSIDPIPNHFIVNFGGAFELLTEPLACSVKAILHRVRRCEPSVDREDRFSFAAFANPLASSFLYQVHNDGCVVKMQSVEDFLREFNEATWKDRYSDFGLAKSEEFTS